MNKDKIGLGTISYLTRSFFCLVMPRHTSIFHPTNEGIAQGHAKGKVPSIPDFTTINRRINKLNIPINTDKER